MSYLPDNYAMGVTRILQEVWLQFNAAIWVVTTWVSNNQSVLKVLSCDKL